ncbi:MAG: hypothetical protein ACR2OB_09745 [Solirubrobacteraceae bacterium]
MNSATSAVTFRRTVLGCVLTALLGLWVFVSVAAAAAGVNINAVEGQSFTGNVVNGLVCPLSRATISWGDGTTSAGASDGSSGIQGTHTYAEEGSYSGSVSYTYTLGGVRSCPSGARTTSFQATVHDAPLIAAGANVSGTVGQPVNGVVAHFTDANPGADAGEFSAQITWGDGAKTFGTVTAAPIGGFDVSGTHSYGSAGSFAVSVSIADVGGSTATASATATITGTTSTTTTTTTSTQPPPNTGLPVNLTKPFISFSPYSNRYVCEPGTWQNLPPNQAFAYEWLRRTPGGVVSVVARTRTYQPGNAAAVATFGCRVTVPGVAGSTISTPDFSRLTPIVVPVSAYGNFRIRGIDVFQVVQPNKCATQFSFPSGAFPCMAGGGTPTSYGPAGRLAPGADPRRTSYVGVRIDADKRTTAVVYVDRTSGADNGQPLEVTLTALSHGRPFGAALTRRIAGPLPSGLTPWVSAGERGDPSFGVQFQIPASWLRAAARGSRLDLIAKVGFPAGTPGLLAVECNPRELTIKNLHFLAPSDCGSDDSFRLDRVPAEGNLLALQIRTLELLGNGQGLGSINPPEPLLARARQLFPGGERMSVWPYANWIGVRDQETLTATQTSKPGVTPVVWTCNGVPYPNSTSDTATRACRQSAVAAVVRQWDAENPDSGYNATVGFHDYAIPLGSGTVKEPGVTFGSPTTLNPGDQLPLSLINDGTIGRPLGATAHELGHVLGLSHASPACGAAAGEAWPPDQIGRLQGVEFDHSSGDPVTPVVDSPLSPLLFDLMTYCGPGSVPSSTSSNQVESSLWLSARNWNHTFDTLAGGPKRAAERSASARATASASSGQAFATGVVGPGGARIVRVVQPHGHDAIPAPAPASPLRLHALDAAGRLLVDEGVQVQPLLDSPGSATFVAPVPVGAAAVELISHGAVVDHRQRNRPPRVRLLAPGRRAHARSRGSLPVRWSASDPDGDQLQATVDYSFDGGRSWRTVFDGPSTGSASVPGRFLEGSRRARIRVYVNDGFNEANAVSPVFRADGTPPVAQIVRPSPGEPVRGDERTVLIGSAFDDRHRPLRGRALTWYAGRHRLGSGEQLEATLPAGRVLLRLVARDRTGHQTTRQRVLHVVPALVRLRQLSAPDVIRHRARTITVRVAASTAATLTTGGQRYHIGRRPRTIVVRLPARPASGLLTLPIQLVAGGPGPASSARGAIVVVRL